MPKILDCVECTHGYLDSDLIEKITARAKTRHMLEATEDVVSSLTVLYENSGFTRSWTFQEVTCAPDAEVFAGRLRIALTVVSNFTWVFPGWYDIRNSAQLSITASRAMGQTLIITTYRDLCKNPSLLELAKDTRERQATDPKDKLYSLLGIASDIDPLCFAPNYLLETAKVYDGFAAHAIAESKKLEILQYSIYVENRTEEQGYCRPYWAPDWSISESLPWIDTIKEPFKPRQSSIT